MKLKYFNEAGNWYTSRRLITVCLLILASFFQTINPVFAQGTSSIVCPTDIVKNSDQGQCGATVNFAATVPANQNITVMYSRQPGALFPVGTTTVEVKAFDDVWNLISSCSFNVTVLNKGLPTIGTPGNIVAFANNSDCGAVVNFATPTVTKNCQFKSKVYSFTGSPQTFTVPAGVTSINVDVAGAAGGHASSADGNAYGYPGLGGRVEATIPVTEGQQLSIMVGGKGHDATATGSGAGGYNGGANGGAYESYYTGGGGGGATDIRTINGTLLERLIVAGGGGASGWYGAGGNGGDLTGADGYGDGTIAGGGTQTAGGIGGTYYNYFFASNGSFGFGGAAAPGTQGGGGGAGWYGGGGGAFGDGGGGSSYTLPTATNVIHTQGFQETDGSVTISYNQPATLVQIAGLPSGSTFPVGTTVNTFKATDQDGNTSESSFAITVKDTTRPLITAPASITIVAGKGDCGTLNVDLGTPVSSDNCIGTVVSNNAPSILKGGVNTITWIATDASGNISTATQTVTVIDDEKPVLNAPAAQTFSHSAGSYTIPVLTASDNCGVASVSYNVTGATTRSGSGTNASGSFNAGNSAITWTAIDNNGNTETATTNVTVSASAITGTIADVWAVAPWGVANKIYIGFGPATLTLTTTIINGVNPYTYQWRKTGSSVVIGTSGLLTVSNAGEYVVTVTDAAGSVVTLKKVIAVEDVTCGNGNDKVTICHQPANNNDKAKTICVSRNSVEQFLGNGNYLGTCTVSRIAADEVSKEVKVKLFPNPTTGKFSLRLNNTKVGKAEVFIMTTSGITISKKAFQLNEVNQLLKLNLTGTTAGLYLVKVVTGSETETLKVMVQP